MPIQNNQTTTTTAPTNEHAFKADPQAVEFNSILGKYPSRRRGVGDSAELCGFLVVDIRHAGTLSTAILLAVSDRSIPGINQSKILVS